MANADVRALLFDVFGTVVDWRGSLIRTGRALSERTGVAVDWPAFADRWRREGYLAPIARVVAGEEPWREVEDLLQAQFDVLASEAGFLDLPAEELVPLPRCGTTSIPGPMRSRGWPACAAPTSWRRCPTAASPC